MTTNIQIKTIEQLYILHIAKLKTTNDEPLQISGLDLPMKARQCSLNEQLRILWLAPNKWLAVSEQPIKHDLSTEHFALTDLSHARSIIEIEGDAIFDVIKKGCPANINNLQVGQCLQSTYKGVNFTLDYLSAEPNCFRLMVLRSYGNFFRKSIEHAS